MLCQSFAKNFGLYGERAGGLSFITSSKSETDIVMSRLKSVARPIYSNPPINGARLIDIVLGDKELTKEWHQELKIMSGRMAGMRSGFVQKLKEKGNPHSWQHI